jgi:hypothetical protein
MIEPNFSRLAQVTGHRFDDDRLASWATDTSSRAFGSLETLGDAIADFAVGLTCWRNGIDGAAQRTSNAALDAIYHQRLEGIVRANSGDVVEALIGAVHLDAGFEAAAALATRWCCPGLDWEPLGDHDVDELVHDDGLEFPAGLAADALDALVADVIVTTIGPTVTTQKMIHRLRVRVVDGPGRARLARRFGLRVRTTERTGIAEPIRASVLTTLLTAGWDRTSALLAPHIDLGRLQRTRH